MLPPPSYFSPAKPQAGENWPILLLEATERLKALSDTHTDPNLAEFVQRMSSFALDFGQRSKLTRLARLATTRAEHLSPFRKLTIGFVGNATLSFLCGEVAAAGLSRSLLIEVVEAPFDTAAPLAFGASDAFDNYNLDAIVYYTDAGGLSGSTLLDSEGEARAIQDNTAHISSIASALRQRFRVPVIVPTLVARPDLLISSADGLIYGTHARMVQALNTAIAQGAAQDEWIVWDLQSIAHDIGLNQWFDPVRFYQAKAPFALDCAAPTADHLCALLAAMSGLSRRALILDLDNTLWGGVIGDDGLDGIILGPGTPAGEAYQAFQAFVLDLHRRGVVLAVSSKNEDHIARSAFREHPHMLLREEHISVFQANWKDKASNIRAISDSLKLGLGSLVFVDDNPAECELVRRELPQVAVPHMREDPAFFSRILNHSRFFEHLNLNQDDLIRADSYRLNAEITQVKSGHGDYAAYLESLQMRLEISPCNDSTHGRITQLINKTNQFNLTTKRYNGEEVRALMQASNTLIWQAQLTDKFADYGTIGVLIVHRSDEKWHIDTWLQSCRVLERGVEQTLMNALVEHALTDGIECIHGSYRPTERNTMVADLYTRLGFSTADDLSPEDELAFVLHTRSYQKQKSCIEVCIV